MLPSSSDAQALQRNAAGEVSTESRLQTFKTFDDARKTPLLLFHGMRRTTVTVIGDMSQVKDANLRAFLTGIMGKQQMKDHADYLDALKCICDNPDGMHLRTRFAVLMLIFVALIARLPAELNAYQLTNDNFTKMCMVLLRIRSRIPVIIMGETGCGKTSLVRFLSNIVHATFEVRDIHAGTTEESLHALIEQKIKEARATNEYEISFDIALLLTL